MKPVLTRLAETLETERTNTKKFRRQLDDLLNQNNPPQLLERLSKGRVYYRSFLFTLIRLLLAHLEAMKSKKRVKTYVTQLTELDQTIYKKLEEVDTTLQLTEGILRGESNFDFNPLTRQRTEERTALISEIHKEIYAKEPAVRKRKSRRDTKTKKAVGLSTYDITLEMFNKGMTIAQIAKERELVISTIEGHLSKAIESSRLDIHALVSEAELSEITEAIHQLPPEFISKDLYDRLNGKYGYGKLRAVMNHLKEQD
jgi:uncharacterized protein YpbB